MVSSRRFSIVIVLFLLLSASAGWSAGTSPRYELFGRARVVRVDSANLLRLRIIDRNRGVFVRLLGVGSPHNRDRIKKLNPGVTRFIRENRLWAVARDYVRSLVAGKVVEVWTRQWNKLDGKRRLLAYLVIPDSVSDPVDLNAEIIRNGMGFVTRDYLHVTFAAYKRLEEEAKRDRRGLWRALPGTRFSLLAR